MEVVDFKLQAKV